MATADPVVAQPPAPPTLLVFQRINDLSQKQKLSAAAAIALAIAMLVGVWLWSRSPDYAVLFSNLEERDGGAIVAALQQQNVPYRFAPGGGAILIPSAMVHDVRLRLAAQGLPKGGLVGFELMENQKLGVSQFHEQVNFQRALEGELARTIQSVGAVASARVHLAMPKQSGFLRDEQKPTASVLVNLRPGRTLDAAQVAGVVHLVSSSVPRLANADVSVIDQNGTLLTTRSDPMRNAGLDATQLGYVRELEAGYIRRIETILAPIVGADNFKAQVTADVDFDQVEQTAERYKPNPAAEQAIRSQQTSEQTTREPRAEGVPGALTNQPPAPATAPITSPDVANAAAPDGPPLNSNRASTVNYELDRTIEHTRQALGQVRRLSVAVVVNERTETTPNGETRSVPLTDAELARLTSLVREAMGYSAQRGDSLNVSGAAFAEPGAAVEPPLPAWKDPELQALGRELVKYAVVLIAFAFVYFGVIRPLVRAIAPPARPEPEVVPLDDDGDEGVIVELAAPLGPSFDDKLQRAREIARSDPKVIANLIKDWIGAHDEGRK